MIFLMTKSNLEAHPIDMEILAEIESSNNPLAVSQDNCWGLYQISEITLRHFNLSNPKLPTPYQENKPIWPIKDYTLNDLFDPFVNRNVANWYLNWIETIQIQIQIWRSDTHQTSHVDDILIAYNWGMGNWRKWIAKSDNLKKLPKETQNYLKRYHELLEKKEGGLK